MLGTLIRILKLSFVSSVYHTRSHPQIIFSIRCFHTLLWMGVNGTISTLGRKLGFSTRLPLKFIIILVRNPLCLFRNFFPLHISNEFKNTFSRIVLSMVIVIIKICKNIGNEVIILKNTRNAYEETFREK